MISVNIVEAEMVFQDSDDVLAFAIAKEEEAAGFYRMLASTMKREHMRKVFEEFSQEEMRHKALLLDVKGGKKLTLSPKQITDLHISDHLVTITPHTDMDYKQSLIISMKAEQAALSLYTLLAQQSADDNLQILFRSLAQEEARHKLRFEMEYDQQFSGEN